MRLPSFIAGWVCALALAGAASLWRGLPLGQIILIVIATSFLAQLLYLCLILLLSLEHGRNGLNSAVSAHRHEDPVQLHTDVKSAPTTERHVL